VFYILPDMETSDPMQEDTENIIRMMAVRQTAKYVRIVLLLLKAENMQLIRDGGMQMGNLLDCIAVDQFKFELVGKTCLVPGFQTLVCNLCCTTGDDEDDTLPAWQQEYFRGAGNELYEVELNGVYNRRQASFLEVCMDVCEHSDWNVYLVGLVELQKDGERKVLLNPGPRYPIKAQHRGLTVSGIFIAPDRESIVQCSVGGTLLGRKDRTDGGGGGKKNVVDALGGAPGSRHYVHIDDGLLGGLSVQEQGHARELVQLASKQRRAAKPGRPPMKMLAKGGHIVVLCLGAEDGDFRLGIELFLQPLRNQVSVAAFAPVIVVAPHVPNDWYCAASYKKVYFLEGSPLSSFDLERAAVRRAAQVFVCHAAHNSSRYADAWMTDAEVICCTRLVESQLGPESNTTVITELFCDTNHRFIPLTSLSNADAAVDDEIVHLNVRKSQMQEAMGAGDIPASRTSRLRQSFMATLGDDGGGAPGGRASVMGGERNKGRASIKELYDLPEVTHEDSEDEGKGTDDVENVMDLQFYRQPRYACGQLFIGNVVSSLAANTLYNPSLTTLVSTMVSGKVSMVPVPRDWIGKPYVDFFEYLLWSQEVLACGIYRKGEYKGPRAMQLEQARIEAEDDDFFGEDDDDGEIGGHSPAASAAETEEADDDHKRKKTYLNYVYTSPPGKDTLLLENDRIICFSLSVIVQADREKEIERELERLRNSQFNRMSMMADESLGGDIPLDDNAATPVRTDTGGASRPLMDEDRLLG
jgi:hypothetical protein